MFALPVEFDLVLEEAAVEAGGSRKIGQHSTGDICPSREEHSRDGDDIMSIVYSLYSWSIILTISYTWSSGSFIPASESSNHWPADFFLGSLGSPWHTMTTYGLAGKGTDSSPSEYLRFAHREVPRHLRSRRGAWGDFVGLGGVWVNLGGIRLGSLDVFGRSFDWTCGILHPGFLWYAHIIPSLLQLHALHMKLLVEHNRPWLGMLGWHRTQHSPAVERPVQIRGVHFFGVTWKQIGRWRDLIWECLGEYTYYTSRPQMDGHVWCWAFSTQDFFWGGADCLIVLRAQGWKIRYTSRSPSVSWTYRGWSRHRPSWNQWFVNQVRYLLWTNDACMVNFINILYQWFANFHRQSPSFDLILDMVMENFASGHLFIRSLWLCWCLADLFWQIVQMYYWYLCLHSFVLILFVFSFAKEA